MEKWGTGVFFLFLTLNVFLHPLCLWDFNINDSHWASPALSSVTFNSVTVSKVSFPLATQSTQCTYSWTSIWKLWHICWIFSSVVKNKKIKTLIKNVYLLKNVWIMSQSEAAVILMPAELWVSYSAPSVGSRPSLLCWGCAPYRTGPLIRLGIFFLLCNHRAVRHRAVTSMLYHSTWLYSKRTWQLSGVRTALPQPALLCSVAQDGAT